MNCVFHHWEKKQVRSTEIDYSKIHKYLHQAIYLSEDVIYLDEMSIAKNVLVQESPPIVQLFCFIYTEIKKELEETESISDKAFELAEKFKDAFLQADSGLFEEDSFADTINILKIVFEEIDSKTTYKDEDFWHFYEAVEAFLTGERQDDEEGVYFGINSFYDIWEDLCQTHILSSSEYLPKVLFADVKGKLLTRKDLGLQPELEVNPFKMEINTGFKPRFLRPDLVVSEIEIKLFNHLFSYTTTKYKSTSQDIFFLAHLQYETIKSNYSSILNKQRELTTQEINNKNPDKPFKYISSENFIIFQNFVQSVLDTPSNSLTSQVKVIDYKYMRQSDYEKYDPNTIDEKGENKIRDDIHKQLIYEWTVQKNFQNSETKSEFWIPCYSDNVDFETSKQELNITNSYFLPSQIKVVKVNFKVLQENYIKLSTVL